MRTLILGLLAALVLGGGAAFAQTGAWGGLSGGYPGAAAHFGVEDVGVENLDARVNLGYAYAGAAGFALGVDGLYGLNLDTGELAADIYVGAGVGMVVGEALALKALAGGEYRFVDLDLPQVGLFLEVGPSFGIDMNDEDLDDDDEEIYDGGFGFDARLGVNYHFDF
jgi:hypothetical protein